MGEQLLYRCQGKRGRHRFLRKIVRGGADKSYGIQVARLAGVPDSVINRAKELVEELSDADITAAVKDLTAPKKAENPLRRGGHDPDESF